MDWVSSLAIILGIVTLLFILLAYLKGEFSDMETPKYEMLGLEKPRKQMEISSGRIGIEDRIIRLGLVGAAFYYATRIGWDNFIGVAMSILGTYLLATGLLGWDPLYKLMNWDTKLPDQ